MDVPIFYKTHGVIRIQTSWNLVTASRKSKTGHLFSYGQRIIRFWPLKSKVFSGLLVAVLQIVLRKILQGYNKKNQSMMSCKHAHLMLWTLPLRYGFSYRIIIVLKVRFHIIPIFKNMSAPFFEEKVESYELASFQPSFIVVGYIEFFL